MGCIRPTYGAFRIDAWVGKVLPSLFLFWKLRAPTTCPTPLSLPRLPLLNDGQQGGFTKASAPLFLPDNRTNPVQDTVLVSRGRSLAEPQSQCLELCSLPCVSCQLSCPVGFWREKPGLGGPCKPHGHTSGWVDGGGGLPVPELARLLISDDFACLLP